MKQPKGHCVCITSMLATAVESILLLRDGLYSREHSVPLTNDILSKKMAYEKGSGGRTTLFCVTKISFSAQYVLTCPMSLLIK